METDVGSFLLVSSSVTNSVMETVVEQLPPRSAFKRNPEGADIIINPPRMIAGVAPENQSWFKCYICQKISAGGVYECTDEHVVCDGCHPLLKRPICRFVDEYRQAVCRKPLRLSPSKTLSNVLRNSKFSCINPACQEIVGGGEDWIRHLDSCTNDYVACPDHRCNSELIQKEDFVQHFHERHRIELQTEGPFFFQFKKPVGPSSSKTVSVVCLIKVMDRIMYLAAQFVSSRCVLLCCFLLDRDLEFVKRFELEIAPVVKKPADMMVKVTTRVNLPGRDMNEVRHFGRSAIFIIPELNRVFGFNKPKSTKKQMYRFSLKFESIGVDLAGLPCLEGISLASQVDGGHSSWRPIPQEALVKLEVDSKDEGVNKEQQKTDKEKVIAKVAKSTSVDPDYRHHFKRTLKSGKHRKVFYHIFEKDTKIKSERIDHYGGDHDMKIIPVKPVANSLAVTQLLRARGGRKI